MKDTFASYIGWFVPFGAPLALVLPEPLDASLEEAATQLFRIGYERIDGVLAGGMAAWEEAGLPTASYPVLTATAARERARDDATAHVLDVRDAHELRDDGMVPGAIIVPIGELPGRLASLPADGPFTVMCKSGARASIAASMLDAAGRDVRLIGRWVGRRDWLGR